MNQEVCGVIEMLKLGQRLPVDSPDRYTSAGAESLQAQKRHARERRTDVAPALVGERPVDDSTRSTRCGIPTDTETAQLHRTR